MRHSLASICLLVTACSIELPPENPFDPEAPRGRQQSGTVSGVLDTSSGPAPAEGQRVRFVPEEEATIDVTTSAGGAFAATLQPGRYDLYIELRGYAPLVRPNVRVLPGAATDLGTLALLSVDAPPSATLAAG